MGQIGLLFFHPNEPFMECAPMEKKLGFESLKSRFAFQIHHYELSPGMFGQFTYLLCALVSSPVNGDKMSLYENKVGETVCKILSQCLIYDSINRNLIISTPSKELSCGSLQCKVSLMFFFRTSKRMANTTLSLTHSFLCYWVSL